MHQSSHDGLIVGVLIVHSHHTSCKHMEKSENKLLVQKITSGALWTELAAVALLGATVLAFDYFNSSDSGYYTY